MSEHPSSTPFIDSGSKDKYGKKPLQSWVGKVASYDTQKDQIKNGWGWRYKVRILGDHSNGGSKSLTVVPDEKLSYAYVLLPTTAGSGAAYKLRSVRISQGDMVYGIQGGDGPRMILGVFPRTRQSTASSGIFGTLSGFTGSLEDTGILDGEHNEQTGPKFLKGASGLDPKEWTKATASNPSEKVKKIVPSVEKNDKKEFEEISEEEIEKNDVKNTAGKVNDAWKPGDNLNTATMEYLKESFDKGTIPPETWEAALKQASEQGIVGYEEYVVKEQIKQEVIPKKVEYEKSIVEAVNQAKNPPFDSWERVELAKLSDKGEVNLLDNGKIGISAEIGIRFQERTDILKEMNRLEESIKFDYEFEGTTISTEDSTGVKTYTIPKPSEEDIQKDKERLLYLTKQLRYIEDGGVVKYSGELTQ